MWTTDRNLRLLEARGGALAGFEIHLDDASPKPNLPAFFQAAGDDTPIVAAHRQALNGELNSFQFDWRGRHYKGYVAPEIDNVGQVVGCIGVAQPASLGQPDDRALLDSELRFQTLVDLSPAGVYVTDAAGDCVYVNQRWCEMTGLRPDEARGRGWLCGIHQEDREMVADRWYALTESQGKWGLEFRMQNPQGDTTWVYGQATTLRDSSGQHTGFLGVNVDISERKDSENLLNKILLTSAAAIMLVDPEGRIIFCNQRAEDILGIPPQQAQRSDVNIKSLPLTDFDGNPIEENDLPFRRVLAEMEAILGTRCALQQEGGERKYLKFNAAPLIDAAGKISGVVYVVEDMTTRIRHR
jgi:PAS domain S-box-containing protein